MQFRSASRAARRRSTTTSQPNYRALNCPVRNQALGTDYAQVEKRAVTLNGIFDEWDQQRKGLPISAPNMPKYGTVDWLFRAYKISKTFTEKVAQRSRRDYEWSM